MILSKQDYETYLKMDMISTGSHHANSLVSKIKDLLFPSYEWQFIKALRWLEYCENVKKNNGTEEYLYGLWQNVISENFPSN